MQAMWMGSLVVSAAVAAQVPEFEVETANGAKLTRTAVQGHRWIFWYEAPDTVELNDDVKAELTALLDSLPAEQRPQLVAHEAPECLFGRKRFKFFGIDARLLRQPFECDFEHLEVQAIFAFEMIIDGGLIDPSLGDDVTHA